MQDKTALTGENKGFGVFGYHNTATNHSSETNQTFEANLFNNQQVTCLSEGADWTYTPVRYWPKEGHIDFLAYAPYDANKALKKTTEASGTESKNTSCIDFTVSGTIANQTDLLWANAENKTKDNLSSTENKVKFQFAHALSRLGYTVKTNVADEGITITLNNIKLAGSDNGTKSAFYKVGTIDLAKADKASGLWNASTSDGNKQNFDLVSNQTLGKDGFKSDKEYLFVIPQNFESGNDELYVIVNYTITYNNAKEGTIKTMNYLVSSKIEKNFEQGKAYMINLTIGLTPIEFNAEVTPWTEDGNSETGIDINSWN